MDSWRFVTYASNSRLTSAFFLNACSQASFLNSSWPQFFKKLSTIFWCVLVSSWRSFGQIKSNQKGPFILCFSKKQWIVNSPLYLYQTYYFILAKCDLAAISHTYFCQKIKPTRYIVYQLLQIYIGCMSIRKLPIKIVIYYSNFGLLGALIIAKISG
jgi:hypothetical protein